MAADNGNDVTAEGVLRTLTETVDTALATATRIEHLYDAAQSACRTLCFRHFLFGLRVPYLDQPLQRIVTDYPLEFLRWYSANQAMVRDPNVQRALEGPDVFDWNEQSWAGSAGEVRKALVAMGAPDGMSCSTYGPNESGSYLALASGVEMARHPVPRPARLAAAAWLGKRLHARAVAIIHQASGQRPRFDDLTEREKQCLRRFARGERASAIARALNVTPRTVNFYLESIARKLGAETHREAAYRAMLFFKRDLLDYPLKLDDVCRHGSPASAKHFAGVDAPIRGAVDAESRNG